MFAAWPMRCRCCCAWPAGGISPASRLLLAPVIETLLWPLASWRAAGAAAPRPRPRTATVRCKSCSMPGLPPYCSPATARSRAGLAMVGLTYATAEAEQTDFRAARLLRWRVLVLLLFCSLLVRRCCVLQVARHDAFAERAESNRTAVVPIVPNRGQILDRNGIVLATNYSAYTLEITPLQGREPGRDHRRRWPRWWRLPPRDRRQFKRLTAGQPSSFESVPLRSRLSDEEVARFAAQRWRFPGRGHQGPLVPQLPAVPNAAATWSATSAASTSERRKRMEDSDDWPPTTAAPKSSASWASSKATRKQLHGTTGWEQLETTAGGFAVRRLNSTPGHAGRHRGAVAGHRAAEDGGGAVRRAPWRAGGHRPAQWRGAGHGQQAPTYDLNLFVDGIDQRELGRAEQLHRPPAAQPCAARHLPARLHLQALHGAWPAWKSGKRTGGHHHPGQRQLDLWRPHLPLRPPQRADQPAPLHHQVVQRVLLHAGQRHGGGQDPRLPGAAWALARPTGIDVQGEARGVLPSTEWKRNTYKRPEQQKWFAGETISLGIGQGYNNFTMLQVANATAMLANHGVQHTARTWARRGWMRSRQHTRRWTRDAGHAHGLQARARRSRAQRRGGRDGGRHGARRVCRCAATTRAAEDRYGPGGDALRQKEKYNAAKLAEHQRDHSLYIGLCPGRKPQDRPGGDRGKRRFGAPLRPRPLRRRVFDYWLLGHYPSEEDMAASAQRPGVHAPSAHRAAASEMMARYERVALPSWGPPCPRNSAAATWRCRTLRTATRPCPPRAAGAGGSGRLSAQADINRDRLQGAARRLFRGDGFSCPSALCTSAAARPSDGFGRVAQAEPSLGCAGADGVHWLKISATTMSAAPHRATGPMLLADQPPGGQRGKHRLQPKDDGAAHGVHALLAPGLQYDHEGAGHQAQVDDGHPGVGFQRKACACVIQPPKPRGCRASSITRGAGPHRRAA